MIEPTTRLAIGADAASQRLMMAVWAGSGSVRVTRWLVAVLLLRRTSPVLGLMVSVVSVTTRPNEEADVTSRGLPAGSGMEHTYGWWVCPVTTRSISGSRSSAMVTIGPEMPLHCW